MSYLDSGKYISQFTVPGTHDTTARYGGRTYQAQSWFLYDQLMAGIRFVDMRVLLYPVDGELIYQIDHADVFNCITLQEVIDTIAQFFLAYPTEFVFMRIKNDGVRGDEPSPLEFDEAMHVVFKNYSDIFYLENRTPKLSEVHGKVVVLREFDRRDDFGDMGLLWSRLPKQDWYNLKHFGGLDRKEFKIKKFFYRAMIGCPRTIHINHFSGIKKGAGPCGVARGYDGSLNETEGMLSRINRFFDNWSFKSARLGIIPMDFPGCDMIHRLIAFNFDGELPFKNYVA